MPSETIERPPAGLARGVWEARPPTVMLLAALIVLAATGWAYWRRRHGRTS